MAAAFNLTPTYLDDHSETSFFDKFCTKYGNQVKLIDGAF